MQSLDRKLSHSLRMAQDDWSLYSYLVKEYVETVILGIFEVTHRTKKPLQTL
ncbi:hypothetical protein [cyanobacterium endosymbiont of Epithemia turgida]|uniref:hypothetical protein n=1 Tax=cyanobacterium endosymbiont of Epithemia turgida TaxID=718217 RepID=UPI001E53ECF5|nr:hypothetical protein [cyanobacterium endosymbiont of Epithemia turgida]